MGKISSGCDIAFYIGNSEPIRMGTSLSYEQSTIQAIAQELMQQADKRVALKDALKYETSTREVTKEEVEAGGLVHNAVVYNLANMYSGYDWSNIDQTTKLLMVDWMRYYGEDYSSKIIVQRNPNTGNQEKIIVIDPSDQREVDRLHQYLTIQSKLKNQTEEIQAILQQSSAKIILEQLPKIKEKLQESYNKYKEYDEKEELTAYQKKKKNALSAQASQYAALNEYIPSTIEELMQDFLDNNTKYIGISFDNFGQATSIHTELTNIIKQLEGKNVREATYSDVFANEIVSNSKFTSIKDGDRSKTVSAISKSHFMSALRIKLEDLKRKASELTAGSEEYKQNIELQKYIEHFQELQNKDAEKWKQIVTKLIELSDDEFSYKFDSVQGNILYLQNVPRTLEERYTDFSYQTINMMRPEQSYRGYNIYVDKDGNYYYDRHVLTTKSYGKKYTSLDGVKKAIDYRLRNDPVRKQSLIEFKTMGDRNVVYVPNRFLPGQVLKVLDMHFSSSQKLNSFEQSLIYDTGMYNSNTLQQFYQYVLGIVDTDSKEYIRKQLQTQIDTAEKAACFIYALNEQEGIDRQLISLQAFTKIMDRFNNPTYSYYVVEEVASSPVKGGRGYKDYITTSAKGEKVINGTYRTLVTPIPSSDIHNSLVSIDEGTARPAQSIRLLDDLAQKLYDKLGVQVHVETQSNLEDLFREWGEEMPSDVHGFVRGGEIYINSSTATDEDFIHEYTHLMLGVLKARNYDNYYELVNIVGSLKECEYLKKSIKKAYPNLADVDLNEEVFAAALGKHLSGHDLGMFLNGELQSAKQAVDSEMGSIFSKAKITDEFYHSKLRNVLSQFSYDLGKLMQEGNGLEIAAGTSFRQATNWIAEQIQKYNENGELGIQEICD